MALRMDLADMVFTLALPPDSLPLPAAEVLPEEDPAAEAYALLDEDYLNDEDDELSNEEFDSDDDSDVED